MTGLDVYDTEKHSVKVPVATLEISKKQNGWIQSKFWFVTSMTFTIFSIILLTIFLSRTSIRPSAQHNTVIEVHSQKSSVRNFNGKSSQRFKYLENSSNATEKRTLSDDVPLLKIEIRTTRDVGKEQPIDDIAEMEAIENALKLKAEHKKTSAHKHTSIHQGDVCGKISSKISTKIVKRSIFRVKRAVTNPIPPKDDERLIPQHRIYNGEQVDIEKYPWQASLFYHGFLTCGGSVLNKNWIVTAAHCTSKRRIPKLWTIYTGAADLKSRGLGESQKRIITTLIQHPDYKDDYTYNNDITLLRFDEPLKYSDITQPICLPDENEVFPPNKSCFVSGWGRVNSESNHVMFPTTLNHVEIDIIDKKLCTKPDWLGNRVNEKMICAGKMDGKKDACQGDSGGPLSFYDSNENVWKLAGIVSWGIGCGLPKKPGVYTNTAYFLPWITKTIADEEKRIKDVKLKTKKTAQAYKRRAIRIRRRRIVLRSKRRNGRRYASYGKSHGKRYRKYLGDSSVNRKNEVNTV